ncbi:MAG: phosphoserine phosphatase SerB [Gammaproteobacteria bacterium]
MSTIILQGSNLTIKDANSIANQFNGKLHSIGNFYQVKINHALSTTEINQLREHYHFDINQLPADFEPKQVRLLVTDMDSTFINIECVDEIADFAGIKTKVAEITESAMRGEIDFETSLTRRVRLLRGLSTSVLSKVYEERLRINQGAEVMLQTLRDRNIRIALVSGGFTYFTDRLQHQYQLDYTLANTLEIKEGKLTGGIHGKIVGAQSKADFLLALCDKLDINPMQVIAMGDGANDLLMMKEAGLSIAYHAKPKVQRQASVAINYCGLDGLPGLLG